MLPNQPQYTCTEGNACKTVRAPTQALQPSPNTCIIKNIVLAQGSKPQMALARCGAKMRLKGENLTTRK